MVFPAVSGRGNQTSPFWVLTLQPPWVGFQTTFLRTRSFVIMICTVVFMKRQKRQAGNRKGYARRFCYCINEGE